MQISYFPNCCGIYVLHTLSSSSTLIRDESGEGDFFFDDDAAAECEEDEYEAPTEGSIEELRDVALMATTISTQTDGIEYLKKHDFKPVYKFNNPNSCHDVTVWMRSPQDGSGKIIVEK